MHRIPVSPLIFAAAFTFLSAPGVASDVPAWVATKTQAFLPQVLAKEKNATGSTDTSTPADSAIQMAPDEPVHVTVSLKLRDKAGLDKFLREINTPGSPSYGKFLTPEQFTKRFAPTEADVGKVVEHLEKSGFINIVVSPNRQLISAEGTAATVQVGFHTTLKNFYLNGVKVFANADAVQVPSALAGIVDAVLGLQNVETAHVQGGALQNTESGEKP